MQDEGKQYSAPLVFDNSSDVKLVPKTMLYDMLDSERLANVRDMNVNYNQYEDF